MRRLAVALLLAVLLCLPAAAAEPEEELEKRLGVSAVEEAAEELTGESVPLAGFQPETALQRLFSGLLQGEAFSRAAASGGKALLILLCCAGAESVFPLGEGGMSSLTLAGAAGMSLLLAGTQQSLLELTCAALNGLQDFGNVLLPTLTAAAAAAGQASGAAAKYAAAALFLNVLLNAVQGLAVPVVRLYIAASAVEAASGSDAVSGAVAFLHWLVTRILTLLMLAFILYISLTGLAAGTADAAVLKAAKTAVSAAVPVVGGIAADAAGSILAAAGAIRSALGIYGLIAALGAVGLPFVQIGAHYLAYRGAAALCGGLAPGRLAALAKRFSEGMGMLLGCLGACGLMLFFSIYAMMGVWSG